MMTKYMWPLVSSALVAVLGAGVLIWPFVVHAGTTGPWTTAVLTDFWSGVGLTVVGLASLGAWYGGLKRDLVEKGLVKAPVAAPPDETPAAGPAQDDLDRLLRPLAESVLRDLTEQLAEKQRRGDGGGTLV